MSRRDPNFLHPALAFAFGYAKPEFEATHQGYQVILTDTFRTQKEQHELYQIGRTKDKDKKIVTTCDGYRKMSRHNYDPALAMDVAFVKDGKCDWNLELFRDFAKLINQAESQIEWGYSLWNWDAPHFQLPLSFAENNT